MSFLSGGHPPYADAHHLEPAMTALAVALASGMPAAQDLAAIVGMLAVVGGGFWALLRLFIMPTFRSHVELVQAPHLTQLSDLIEEKHEMIETVRRRIEAVEKSMISLPPAIDRLTERIQENTSAQVRTADQMLKLTAEVGELKGVQTAILDTRKDG